MDLRRKSMKQLRAMQEERRPEAISQLFLVLALFAGASLSELVNIAHETFKTSDNYSYYVALMIGVGSGFIFSLMYFSHKISSKPYDEVNDEIERRNRHKH